MAKVTPCVFCGGADRGISREHVLAAWVDAIFPEAAKEKAHVVLIRPKSKLIEFDTLPFEQKVGVVCHGCNNTWMSQLETDAAPILTPMVSGAAAVMDLTKPMQQTVATWATKTAFMFEHLHPANRIVPDREYHRFFATRRPAPEYMVFLARRDSIIDPDTRAANLVTSREQEVNAVGYSPEVTREEIRASMDGGAKVYRITVALGHLVFVVLGHTFPNPMNMTMTPNGEKILRCVWPTQERSRWPTLLPIERIGGFEALHNVFDQSTMTPP